MTLNRTRRAGLSLVEVIVAMFIMALGMIALLTLFPLGALQMGQALKDDRCAQAAAAADNVLRTYWKKYVIEQAAGSPDPFTKAFFVPQDASFGPLPGTAKAMPPLTAANAAEPSYPVFVDPRGFDGRQSNPTFTYQRYWVAGSNDAQPRIPRRTLAASFVPGIAGFSPYVSSYRQCTLLDDLTYDGNGSASRLDSSNNQLPVERQGRYTWGWMVQLPAAGNMNFANVTVVVYDTRNPDYPATDGEQIYGRAAAQLPGVQYTIGGAQVLFQYPAGAVPNIKAGQWILDGTQRAQVFSATAQATVNVRLANFYRVTGVEIDESTNTVRLDLQTPIKPLPGVAGLTALGNPLSYFGDLYLLKGVAEVFERRPLVANDVPQ